MHRFVADLASWYDQIKTLPRGVLIKLIRLGAKVAKFVSG
jgi:hypothetical protein